MVDAQGQRRRPTPARSASPTPATTSGEQYTVQANLMANAKVWPAMTAAFEKAQGDLAERMLQALEAAQSAGGDIRGKQSAAILIVKAQSHREAVERSPLRPAGRGLAGAAEGAAPAGAAAPRLHARGPGRHLRRRGQAGRGAEGLRRRRRSWRPRWSSCSSGPRSRCTRTAARRRRSSSSARSSPRSAQWVDLVPRLAKAGLFPDDPKAIEEVQKQKPRSRMGRR